MLIYFGLITIWLLLYLLLNKKIRYNKKKKLLYAFIAGGFLFLVMGLRSPVVGADTNQYLYRYNYIIYNMNMEIFKNSEWGFELFNSLFRGLGFNNQGYILVTSFIISLSISLFFYKYSKNIFISFFLHLTIGMFTMSMSGIRQTLAICFILLAFNYMMKKKFVKFLISVLLAYTFHNSAIVFLPIYLLRNIRVNKKNGIILLLMTTSMLVLRKLVVPIMEKFSPQKYIDRYGLTSDVHYVNPLLIVIAIAIPATCLFFWSRTEELEKNERELFYMLFILSCVNVLVNILSLNSNMIGRLSFYFITFNVVLIPNIISLIKNKKLRTIAIFLCLVLPLIQFVISTPGGTLHIDQYRFFWQ
ncbi:EpsG family protein [Clostridium sp.]|uniref:EpsG family protein n=1 Tax=Clostridium sp. TaxID=1506 RepID=UPI003463FEF7